jgi:diguanylate cyclase (GGDEF)-like protein/PAS domain S-box-containing protein
MIWLNKLKHWIGFALLIALVSFTFYKSSIEEFGLNTHKHDVEDMQRLQIELHRDLLSYRGGNIYQYDTLNNSEKSLLQVASSLFTHEKNSSPSKLTNALEKLKKSLVKQQRLVEDFKMHHSILQNSMIYYSRLSSKLYNDGKQKSRVSAETLGNLSRLILEYTRKPETKTAHKLYAQLDKLNVNPDREVKTLINHSLLIIEKIPEINSIIDQFNKLNIEGQLQNIFKMINELQNQQNARASLYNLLMYAVSLGLLVYLLYLFQILQKSRDTLSLANVQLNKEVSERSRTENTLMQFVMHCSQDYTEDHVHCILNALCKSLNVRYAQIVTINIDSETGASADIVDNNHFTHNLPAAIKDTADEDTFARGRLAYNDGLQSYFPATHDSLIEQAVSYIGITLRSSDSAKQIIAVADDKAIDNISLYENILSIAASRLSIEQSRHIALENSIRYQQGLEKIDDWVAQLVSYSNDRNAFKKISSQAAQDISNSSLAALCEVTPDKESYVYAAVSGDRGRSLLGEKYLLKDGGLCAWTINYNESICINDLPSDIRSKRKLVTQLNMQHAILSPVTLGAEVYGCLVTFRETNHFDEIDRQLLSQFCQSMEMALSNMMLLDSLQSQKERAEITLHSIADAVITTDSSGKIDYMNYAAEHLTGWSLDRSIGQQVQTVFRLIDQETREAQHKLSNSCLYDGISINKSTTTLIAQDDTEREIECSMSPIKTSTDVTDGIIIVFHDETERRRMEHTIRHQASHDSLTGLLNRNEFIRQLNDHIFDARDSGRIHIVCYLDLDRFKLVNDTAGHNAGDEMLTRVTRLINSCIRSGDIIARLGGDEFGLILQNCTIDSARHITQNIIDKISGYKLEWDGEIFNIGVSIGIVTIDNNTLNSTEITRQADMACYTAKDHGRNRAYVYQRKDTELARRTGESRWASKISEALSNDMFKLYAQPICPLKNNKTDFIHLEVLIRMVDSNGIIISPSAFVPAAERYNLMGSIDQHIISKTFSHIVSRSDDDKLCYTINLSGNSLSDENLSNFIAKQIVSFGINPSRLCFEVTETAAITNLVNAKKLIDEIRALGCHFALDDFGSGLPSFEYLKSLPVDYLKIDGSFVHNMVSNKIDHAMVAAINQVGHIMGIKTVAEHVENEEIISKLQHLNVDFVQGYGIARPAPIEEFNYEDLSNQEQKIKRRALNAVQ